MLCSCSSRGRTEWSADTEPPERVGVVLWLGINSPEGKNKAEIEMKTLSLAALQSKGKGDVEQPCRRW